MKKYLLFLSLILSAVISFAQQRQASPCNDSLFVQLQAKGVTSLNETEFAYYSQKEKDCEAFTKSLANDQNKVSQVNKEQENFIKDADKAIKKNKNKLVRLWVVLGLIIVGLYFGSKYHI